MPSRRPNAFKRAGNHVSQFVISLAILQLAACFPTRAQVRDSTYTWRAYATIAHCSISIFDILDQAVSERSPRSRLVVLREMGDNPGPSATEDAGYLVDRIGRDFGFDPAEAVFVFHWGRFSFRDAGASRNELFLRATFRRAKNGTLSGPQWRVVRREDLEALTDRAF